MDEIFEHFSDLEDSIIKKLEKLEPLYSDWNEKINLISRKDFEFFYSRHVLQSIILKKMIDFKIGTTIADIGTGGGFPGIPLAIIFPEVKFTLIDSIGKKLKAVRSIKDELELKNVSIENIRAEEVSGKFDFITSRAVKKIPVMHEWIKDKVKKESNNDLKNGMICWKGGDISEEIKSFRKVKVFDLKDYLKDPFFETKKIVHIAID